MKSDRPPTEGPRGGEQGESTHEDALRARVREWGGHEQVRRSFLDDLPFGCQVIDREWRYVYVNAEAVRHGRTESRLLLGRTMMECYPGIERTAMFAELSRCMEKRTPARLDNVFEYPDGTKRSYELTMMPTPDGVLVISIDTTERRQTLSSEARLAAIVESSDEAIVGKTLDAVVTSWNSGAARLYGYQASEMIGRSIELLLPPDHPNELPEIMRRISCGETVEPYETVRLRKDGSRVDVLLTVSPIRDAEGRVNGASAIGHDITARKRAEREARESSARFELIASTIDDVFWMTDVEVGTMYYASPAYERIWGRTRESLYQDPHSFADAIHPDDREQVASVLEWQHQGRPYSHEYRIIRVDGAVRWIADRGYPIFDDGGRPIRYVGVAQDVTERRLAQQRIEEQARLLDVASDAITVRDIDDRITFWSRGAERIFGWTREEAIGKNAVELLGRPADAAAIAERLERLRDEQEWIGELPAVRKDGRELLMMARWTLIRDETGAPREILSVSTDVTERRSLERQLLRAQRMESLGALAAGIAHDLNNVLAPIVMGTEGLLLKGADPGARGIIGIIKASAERGADIVRQILGFARGIEGELAELQLKHLLREVESIIKETFPKNLDITFDVPRELWPILGDATQIHQVLMNICVNARDAMPDGGRLGLKATNMKLDESYARMHIDARPIRYVVIEIEDSGSGMPPGVMEKIFDPFFTTKPPGKGTGLGLSTVLAIVKGHGGFVNVYSEIGKGASFKVYLPASVGADEEPTEEIPETVAMGSGELIVVADDETRVSEIARQILESYGYRVMTAADGTEALAVFLREQQGVSVMIIDMMMPYMDGTATIRALRKLSPSVRIIATSGLLSNEQLTVIRRLGIDAFLPKPFAADTLLRTVSDVISRDRSAGAT